MFGKVESLKLVTLMQPPCLFIATAVTDLRLVLLSMAISRVS